jgi:hypothetical protein
MDLRNGDSVVVMRFAMEASDDGAARSRPRGAVFLYRSTVLTELPHQAAAGAPAPQSVVRGLALPDTTLEQGVIFVVFHCLSLPLVERAFQPSSPAARASQTATACAALLLPRTATDPPYVGSAYCRVAYKSFGRPRENAKGFSSGNCRSRGISMEKADSLSSFQTLSDYATTTPACANTLDTINRGAPRFCMPSGYKAARMGILPSWSNTAHCRNHMCIICFAQKTRASAALHLHSWKLAIPG